MEAIDFINLGITVVVLGWFGLVVYVVMYAQYYDDRVVNKVANWSFVVMFVGIIIMLMSELV